MERTANEATVPRKRLIRRVAATMLFALSVFYLHLNIGMYAFLAWPVFSEGMHLDIRTLIFGFISLIIFVPVLTLIFGYGIRVCIGIRDKSSVFWWFSLVCNVLLFAPFPIFFNYDPTSFNRPFDQAAIFYGAFPLIGIIVSLICI